MKIGPLDNKQIETQQEQAKQTKFQQANSGSVDPSAESRALNERKRLGELADQKKQIDSDRFERSSENILSTGTTKNSYSKKQLENNRLELIKKQVQDGFYDQKNIVNRIADKMIEKLGLNHDEELE